MPATDSKVCWVMKTYWGRQGASKDALSRLAVDQWNGDLPISGGLIPKMSRAYWARFNSGAGVLVASAKAIWTMNADFDADWLVAAGLLDPAFRPGKKIVRLKRMSNDM